MYISDLLRTVVLKINVSNPYVAYLIRRSIMWGKKCSKKQDMMVLGPSSWIFLLNVGVSNDSLRICFISRLGHFDLGAISRVLFCSAFDPNNPKQEKKNQIGNYIFPRKRKKIRTDNDFQRRTIPPSFFACLGYVSLILFHNIFSIHG
jgi:hypothetical protein